MNNDGNELMSETNTTSPRRSSWVAITTGVLGGVLLLGAASSAAVAGVFTANYDSAAKPQLLTETAEGISEIDVDASAARFVLTCDGDGGDSDEFTLSTSNGSREWSMKRHGNSLRVEPVDRWFGGFSMIGPRNNRLQDVSLSLPRSACDGARPLDADLELGAGSLQVDGAFGALDLSVGAGKVWIDGSATALDADVSAGEAVFTLADVRTAEISVSAGQLRGEFTGAAPKRVDIEVSAGSADLWLPDEVYAVTSEVAAGEFENSLRTDQSMAKREIDVEVSAGGLRLHPRR